MSSHNEISELQATFFNGGRAFVFATAAPTDGQAGYAPGCLYVYSVANGSFLYINTATASSSTWTKVGTQS